MDQPPSNPLEYGVEPETKARRRFKRVARIVWRCVWIGMLLAVIAHTVWLLVATRQLNNAVQALVDAGEPMTVEALAYEDVADNGYVHLEAAMAIASRKTKASDRVDKLPTRIGLPLLPIERERLRAWVDEAAEALPALDLAASKQQTATTYRPTSPLLGSVMPDLMRLRATADLTQYSALLEYEQGRHDVAFARTAALEPIACGAGTHRVLIGALIATGIRSIEAQRLLEFAPDLKIAAGRAGAVAPEAVRLRIARLLDSSAISSEFLEGYRAERVLLHETMQRADDLGWIAISGATSSGPQATPAPVRYLFRPWMRANHLKLLEHTNPVIPVLAEPNWPAAGAKLNTIGAPQGNYYAIARLISVSMSRPMEARYRVETDRRLAAMALAVRLYQAEHDGKLPPSLEALVPNYLPAVPLDPMASGDPLRAQLDGDQPRLWSVGRDARNDGGDAKDGLGDTPDDEWKASDRVIPLTRTTRVLTERQQAELDELIAEENGLIE